MHDWLDLGFKKEPFRAASDRYLKDVSCQSTAQNLISVLEETPRKKVFLGVLFAKTAPKSFFVCLFWVLYC